MKRLFGRKKPGASHPDTHEMLSYLESALDGKRRLTLEAHLASPCFDCQARLRDCGRLVERMRADRTPEVPQALRRIALEAFDVRLAAAPPIPFAARVAQLLFDTLGQPMPQAVRSSVGEVRRLRFEAGGATIELECEMESAARFTLRGRIEAAEPELHQVRISVDEERFLASTDSAGLFSVTGLPSGRADVTIEGPEGVWTLPGFDLEV